MDEVALKLLDESDADANSNDGEDQIKDSDMNMEVAIWSTTFIRAMF